MCFRKVLQLINLIVMLSSYQLSSVTAKCAAGGSTKYYTDAACTTADSSMTSYDWTEEIVSAALAKCKASGPAWTNTTCENDGMRYRVFTDNTCTDANEVKENMEFWKWDECLVTKATKDADVKKYFMQKHPTYPEAASGAIMLARSAIVSLIAAIFISDILI
jgi:hypothetical protein